MISQIDGPATLESTASVSDLGLDLTACDREPIHIPGAIQPHGLLLVADADRLVLVAGAGDLEGRLAPEWLGRPLAAIIGPDAAAALGACEAGEACLLGSVTGLRETFQAVGRLQNGLWLIQLEPRQAEDDPGPLLGWLDRVNGTFGRAPDLRALCERAAIVFRELTGFDRVMVYRFLDDDAGVVVAEDRVPGEDTFLHHHFPASDIPQQARALYVRNRIRVIPDIAYVPQPIRPAEANLATLDLSDIDLRSVSPIHIQYLKNMEVGASASISIVKDGMLWGLIACHHRAPRTISYERRMACQALAGSFALQVRAREEAEDYRQRLRLRTAEDTVSARLIGLTSLDQLVTGSGEELRTMLGADSFAVLQGSELHCVGRCPDQDDMREVAAWVRKQGAAAKALHTDRLGEIFPPARAYRERASGLLTVTVSMEEPIILMWFRAERLEVVNWAGNPHKAVTAEHGALKPRASFEAWSEEIRGRAKPWSLPEIDSAQRLTRAIFEARQNRRIRELNRELAATVSDNQSLLAQKDYLLKEVNHRIQNSLQLVSAFLALQARDSKDDILTGHLSEAQRRLAAVALVHRRLYSDDNVEVIDLGRYFEDLVADMKNSMGEEWSRHITLDVAPILIPTDSAVSIGLVLTELVINAQKYAYAGKPGAIAIGLEQHRNRLRLIVADAGIGKAGATRKGFGSQMLAAMVRQLGGALEETSNTPGLRVIVSAPITPETGGAA
jgi:chemotaxis family two-component system sensor kinase Cph1